jgi:hypothetical protein
LIELAKAKSEKLRFGFGGKGGFNHIVGELFQQQAQLQFVAVAYKGLNEVVTDVAGGHIDLGFPTPGESLSLINAGRVRALAITGPRRLAALPNVPTMGEAGFPQTQLLGWGGLCAPAGTPAPVIKILNEQTLTIMMSASVKADFERRGYEIAPNSAQEFAGFIKAEITRHRIALPSALRRFERPNAYPNSEASSYFPAQKSWPPSSEATRTEGGGFVQDRTKFGNPRRSGRVAAGGRRTARGLLTWRGVFGYLNLYEK